MIPLPASTTCSLTSMSVKSTQSMFWSGKRSVSPFGTASLMAVPVIVAAVSSRTALPS
jgi:hypothetical protein